MQDQKSRIPVGRIAGPYGIKGWLKIVSYTRPPENILRYSPWQLQQGNREQVFKVRDGKKHGKGLVALLEGISSRGEAEQLKSMEILIERSQLHALLADEYYQHDLLGKQVINRQGTVLGTVKEFLDTGANEVLVVQGGEKHLIPWVRDRYISEVDMEQGIIHVDWDPEWSATQS